jgi:hypothetical protein
VAAGPDELSQPAEPVRNRQWLARLVPAFPLVLLVLRLWYLSRQNVQTMLLLLQYVSALGLISTLLVTLVWVFPAIALFVRSLAALQRASTLGEDPGDVPPSWLLRGDALLPDWVVLIAVGVAALTWQMRFLPTLVLLTLSIVGLEVVSRRSGPLLRGLTGFALPVAVGLLEYLYLGPAILQAIRVGEPVTAILLAAPPLFGPLLTGPVPVSWAYRLTHWPAMATALVAPVLIGVIFLRAPILPAAALEIDTDRNPATRPDVLLGEVINVDDRMTTVLDDDGVVHFIINDQVLSRTPCDTADDAPTSVVSVHGWPVEATALGWIAPVRAKQAPDRRCEGRPLG